MAKLDDVLKAMILYHGRRIARELLGELPAQVKQAQRDIRTIHKTLAKLTRQVERLVEQQEPEAPVLAASEDQLKGARLTKRTLPALRKRFSLTQHELAKLLQVGVMTTGIWERGQSQPRRRNVARINALRSMTQEQVDAALGRRPALPAMTPQQIKSLRQKLGLSRQELGEHLGVAASAVKTWEQGKSAPAARHREGLAPIKAMSQEQVNAALRRQPAVPAMSPREIKGLRQKLGLAQGELAKLLGVWAVTVGTWERGRSVPGAANRAALAEIKAMNREELDRRLERAGAPQPEEEPAEQTGLSPEEIVTIRKKAGLTQKGLADVVGVSSTTVSSWETGRTEPQPKNIEKLLAMRK